MMNRKLILTTLKSLRDLLEKDLEVELSPELKFLVTESVSVLETEQRDLEERYHIIEIKTPDEILDTLYDLDKNDRVISVIPNAYSISIVLENTTGESGFSKRQLKKLTPMQRLELANSKK